MKLRKSGIGKGVNSPYLKKTSEKSWQFDPTQVKDSTQTSQLPTKQKPKFQVHSAKKGDVFHYSGTDLNIRTSMNSSVACQECSSLQEKLFKAEAEINRLRQIIEK